MKTIQTLKIFTILYLLIPSILFLLTWIHLWIGIPCVLFIVFFTWKTFQENDLSDSEPSISTQNILLSLGIAITLNFLLGIGEFRYQTYDFQANNFKYYDLITHELPVYYAKQQTYLCYYTGYYLPSALLSKVFGIGTCRYFSFVWSVLGLWLVILWIISFIQKNHWILLATVILFANIWIIPRVMSYFEFFQDYIHDSYIQLNHFKLITESFVKNYAWATQHTLPACLGACMMIEVFRNNTSEKDLKMILLMLLSTMFWSPLSTIGLFPFVAFCFLKNIKSLLKTSNWHNLGFLILLILSFFPLLLYFISTEGVHNNNTEFIWQTGVSIWWIFYLIYVFSNFVGWGLFLKYHQYPHQYLWKIAVIVPCLAAFYRIGIYNDFNIRVSFPSFFMLSILVGITMIEKMNWKSIGSILIVVLILVNSLSNINQLQKGLLYKKLLTTIEKPSIFEATNMLEFQRVAYGDESAILEYSLKKDSVFEKYFLKK